MEFKTYIVGYAVGALTMFVWMLGYAQKKGNEMFHDGVKFGLKLLVREVEAEDGSSD